MGPAELYEVLYAAQSTVNQLMEFMIVISFAVIVASYLASDRISLPLYLLMGSLYTLTYLVLVLRMYVHIQISLDMSDRLTKLGEVLPEVTWAGLFGSFWIVATYVGTLVFLAYWYRKRGGLTCG